MKFLLAFLVLAGLCVFSAQGVTTRFLRHLEPVIGAKIEFANEDEASRLRRSESNQPFPDSLKLSFSGYGKEFNFDLSINSLLVEGAKIRVWGENNELLETYTPPSKNYRQETEDGWANVNLLENGLFNALINHEGELYTVEPLSYHERDLSETNKRSLEEKSELVMYRSSDMVGQDQLLCGAVNSYRKRSLPNGDEQTEIVNATFTPRSSFKGRELLTVAMFSCATVYTTKRFTIGFAADYGFYQVYKTAVTSSDTYGTQGIHDAVLAILSNANMVYKVQINVFLSLGTLDIRTTTGGEDWNQSPPCPSTIDDLLTKFTTWRKTQTDPNNGVYHLLTNCFPPPGTVGLAYVGVLCDNQNGAGVSSDSSTTWLTVAHEVGHNFGANHAFEQGQGTTGGIMDYGDGKYQGEYQFHPVYNQPEVCGELKTAMALTAGSNVVPNCWVDFKPTCGNGMIEDGEDCDDSSSCCSNCKFAPGAVCSTGVCCQNCQYAPTTTNCGNQGYCSNGVCTISPCAGYSNLKFCNVDPTNTCQQTCNYNGQCMSLNNFGLDGSAPDGSVCSTSPYSTCQSGKCVALANAPTSAPTPKPTSAPTTQPTSAPTSGPTSGPTPTSTPTPTNPPPPPTPTPTTVPATTWAVQPWGTCSVTCGGGTQSRNVYCVYAGTSQILSDSQCSGTKPATTQACNTQSCTTVNYYWVTSTGSCNAACDSTGTQTVNVYCAAETDFYTAVSDTLCSGSGAKPASGTQSCTGSPCQSSGGWVVGTWSLCSPKCGAGTQTRSVTCSYGSDSICKFFGPKPASSRPCNGPACAIQWQLAINAWGECSASCGVGIQSRLLQCFDGNQVVDSSYCSGLQKPIVETRPCFVQPCGNLTGPTWVATDNWEACNADCGVQGTQTRIWICVDVDNTRLPDSSCQGGMPQNVVQPCYIPCGDTSPTTSPTNAPGLSTGAIVGIAVGLIGAAIILAGVAIGFFIYTKKSSPYAGKQAPSQSVQSLTPHQGEAANPLYNKN